MALGIGEGGDQASPLGKAVIGGLIGSTIAALLVLPLVFNWVMGKTSVESVSLDPEDKESKHYKDSVATSRQKHLADQKAQRQHNIDSLAQSREHNSEVMLAARKKAAHSGLPFRLTLA